MSKIKTENKQVGLTEKEKAFIEWYRKLSEKEKKKIKSKLGVK